MNDTFFKMHEIHLIRREI